MKGERRPGREKGVEEDATRGLEYFSEGGTPRSTGGKKEQSVAAPSII
jgi:hypothetical protein